MYGILKGDNKKIDHDIFIRKIVELREEFGIDAEIDWSK